MYCALLWKEYRETRLIVFSSIVLSVLIAFIQKIHIESIEYVAFLLLLIVAGTSAIFLGATAFTVERQQENFSFLFGIPVTKKTIWKMKLLIRTLELFTIVLLLYFVNPTIRSLVIFPHTPIFALTLFTSSFLFSLVFKKATLAGACGLSTYMFFLAIFHSMEYPYTLYGTCIFASFASIISSFFILIKKETL